MRSNDLDCDGSLSFEEFIQAMPANVKSISEEEHRYADRIYIYTVYIYYLDVRLT